MSIASKPLLGAAFSERGSCRRLADLLPGRHCREPGVVHGVFAGLGFRGRRDLAGGIDTEHRDHVGLAARALDQAVGRTIRVRDPDALDHGTVLDHERRDAEAGTAVAPVTDLDGQDHVGRERRAFHLGLVDRSGDHSPPATPDPGQAHLGAGEFTAFLDRQRVDDPDVALAGHVLLRLDALDLRVGVQVHQLEAGEREIGLAGRRVVDVHLGAIGTARNIDRELRHGRRSDRQCRECGENLLEKGHGVLLHVWLGDEMCLTHRPNRGWDVKAHSKTVQQSPQSEISTERFNIHPFLSFVNRIKYLYLSHI